MMKHKYNIVTQWRYLVNIQGNESFIIHLNIVMKFQVI